jgi:hypothetical protein
MYWPASILTDQHICGKKKKGDAIPVTGREGPKGCVTLRVPHYLDNRLKDGGKVVLVLISVRG